MSRQNLIPFSKIHAKVTVSPVRGPDGNFTGELSEESQSLFDQNMNFLRKTLSDDGHATPSRTSDELAALSTDQYTTRYNYNKTTGNPVVNVEGIFKNVTVNYPYSPDNILNPTRFEWFTGAGSDLYAALSGTLYQALLSQLPHKLFFQPNASNQLFAQINGISSQAVLADPANPIRLSISDTNLIVSVGGIDYEIPMTPVLEKANV